MIRISVYLVSLFFFFQSSLLAYSSNPKDFVNELVNDAISKLADKNLNKDQKANFIEEVALENVDIKALGLYTLGELRKSSNKEDISNYQISFQKYFLKSLTSRLTDYSSSKFEITGEEKKSANYTIISSKVIPVDDKILPHYFCLTLCYIRLYFRFLKLRRYNRLDIVCLCFALYGFC